MPSKPTVKAKKNGVYVVSKTRTFTREIEEEFTREQLENRIAHLKNKSNQIQKQLEKYTENVAYLESVLADIDALTK